MVTCYECNGTGADPGGLDPFHKTDCEICSGAGEIEEPIADECLKGAR